MSKLIGFVAALAVVCFALSTRLGNENALAIFNLGMVVISATYGVTLCIKKATAVNVFLPIFAGISFFVAGLAMTQSWVRYPDWRTMTVLMVLGFTCLVITAVVTWWRNRTGKTAAPTTTTVSASDEAATPDEPIVETERDTPEIGSRFHELVACFSNAMGGTWVVTGDALTTRLRTQVDEIVDQLPLTHGDGWRPDVFYFVPRTKCLAFRMCCSRMMARAYIETKVAIFPLNQQQAAYVGMDSGNTLIWGTQEDLADSWVLTTPPLIAAILSPSA